MNIISHDEKWVFYENVQCKKKWIDKDDLCVCYFSLSFQITIRLSMQTYIQQWQSVHENQWKCPTLVNRKNVMLLNDNKTTFSKNCMGKSIWFWLVCSTLSTIFPDLSPSNFHLFHSLQNALNDKKSSQEDQGQTFWENLNSKPVEFY